MHPYDVRPIDYDAIQAMARRAREERDALLARGIARGVRFVLHAFARVPASLRTLYDNERRRSRVQASAAIERWSGRY